MDQAIFQFKTDSGKTVSLFKANNGEADFLELRIQLEPFGPELNAWLPKEEAQRIRIVLKAAFPFKEEK